MGESQNTQKLVGWKYTVVNKRDPVSNEVEGED